MTGDVKPLSGEDRGTFDDRFDAAYWRARYRSAELSVVAGKLRREEAEERTRSAEERAHHFLSALESARALIERDVPKEILLDNIRRNLDDAKRGAA